MVVTRGRATSSDGDSGISCVVEESRITREDLYKGESRGRYSDFGVGVVVFSVVVLGQK